MFSRMVMWAIMSIGRRANEYNNLYNLYAKCGYVILVMNKRKLIDWLINIHVHILLLFGNVHEYEILLSVCNMNRDNYVVLKPKY